MFQAKTLLDKLQEQGKALPSPLDGSRDQPSTFWDRAKLDEQRHDELRQAIEAISAEIDAQSPETAPPAPPPPRPLTLERALKLVAPGCDGIYRRIEIIR